MESTTTIPQKKSAKLDLTKISHYTEGNIVRHLIINAIPMVFALGFMLSFNLVDTYFISKLGNKQLAAFTFAFPIVMLTMGVAMGLGVGASAEISKAIGAGNGHRVKRLTTDSIFLALVFVGVFSTIGTIFMDEIFLFMKADPILLPYIKSYMSIIWKGIIFIVIPLVGNAATRATGDTKTPSMIMLITVAINVVLDPIFLFGFSFIPAFGLAGAAWANIISRFISLIISLYILYYRDNMITFKIPSWREFKASAGSILYIAIPSIATNLIVPLGFSVIVGFVAKYGEDAVAALGAASRIEIVSLSIFMAFSTVLGPFVGQNLGAKKHDRIVKAIRYGHIFALIWGGMTSLLFLIFARKIAVGFKDDPNIVRVMVLYLQTVTLAIALKGISINIATVFDVLRKPILATILSISQMFLIFIPLAYYFSNFTNLGIEGIFVASLASSVFVAVVSYLLQRYYLVRLGIRTVAT